MKAEHDWNFTSTYTHPLRTNNIHLASGQSVITDAPVDNHGLGQAFSPTDLLSTSLASCVLTIMGIHVNSKDYDLISANASIQKTMAANPRRVAAIRIDFQVVLSGGASDHDLAVLEKVGRAWGLETLVRRACSLWAGLEFDWKLNLVTQFEKLRSFLLLRLVLLKFRAENCAFWAIVAL